MDLRVGPAAVRRVGVGAVLAAVLVVAAAGSASAGTFSIAAVDPGTGEVGAAALSCVERGLPESMAIVPGQGVVVASGEQELANRNRLFRQLLDGREPQAIIDGVTEAGVDDKVGVRQYAVVTVAGPLATFTGPRNDPWSGSKEADHVVAQGTQLESGRVVDDALAAYRADLGPVRMSDRLMRALEAASAAGGDARCNTAEVRQTAASAFLTVAKPNDANYAPGAEDRNIPWLDLQVSNAKGGSNAVGDLRVRYDEWRPVHLPVCPECDLAAMPVPAGGTAKIKETTKVGVVVLAIEGLICLGVVVGLVWLVIGLIRRRRPDGATGEAAPSSGSLRVAPDADRLEPRVGRRDRPPRRRRRRGGGPTGDHPPDGPGPVDPPPGGSDPVGASP